MAASKKSAGSVTERRQRVEQMRREQQAKDRRRRLLLVAVGVVVVAVIAGLVVLGVSSKRTTASAQVLPATVLPGPATVQKPVKEVPNMSGIDGVVAYDTTSSGSSQPSAQDVGIEHTHVPGPVTYAVTPPVGGPHNGTWANAGVYTRAIPDERAVHDLEHGAVWVTYRPDLPAAEVTQLRDFVLRQSMLSSVSRGAQKVPLQSPSRFVMLSPHDNMASPIVISAWGRQLRVDSPTDPRLQRFVDAFRVDSDLTFEIGSAVDGVPVDQGGRPAAA